MAKSVDTSPTSLIQEPTCLVGESEGILGVAVTSGSSAVFAIDQWLRNHVGCFGDQESNLPHPTYSNGLGTFGSYIPILV